MDPPNSLDTVQPPGGDRHPHLHDLNLEEQNVELEDNYLRGLLSRLDGLGGTVPVPRTSCEVDSDADDTTDAATIGGDSASERSNRLAANAIRSQRQAAESATLRASEKAAFLPLAPQDLAGANVPEGLIEALVMKFILHEVTVSGRAIADNLGLPFATIGGLLARMKGDQWVVYRGTAPVGDYMYQLTSQGTDAALRLWRQGSYCGHAPVSFEEYVASVEAQGTSTYRPKMADVRRVFAPLNLEDSLLARVGQALDAGSGFFLYGAPGNGKTSIAERVSKVFGEFIWIPRAVSIDGHIVRLFDPCNHEEVPLQESGPKEIDRRWVRIRRPAIVVGGELTMDRLEISSNAETGVSESPLQMKSNCGTLVIDDFGRQRMSTVDLLNRWIVPLDRKFDFLHVPGGKAVRVPFQQVLIFSTNLQPHDLVDEAFLRRIPYKIEITDPSEGEFFRLLENYASLFAIPYDKTSAEYLVERHYRKPGRPLRRCHARDLLAQIHHYCRFSELPAQMTPEYFDMVALNYFALSRS